MREISKQQEILNLLWKFLFFWRADNQQQKGKMRAPSKKSTNDSLKLF